MNFFKKNYRLLAGGVEHVQWMKEDNAVTNWTTAPFLISSLLIYFLFTVKTVYQK